MPQCPVDQAARAEAWRQGDWCCLLAVWVLCAAALAFVGGLLAIAFWRPVP